MNILHNDNPNISRPTRTIKPTREVKKSTASQKAVKDSTTTPSQRTPGRPPKKRTATCSEPDCGQEFAPVSALQKKCPDCIAKANAAAKEKANKKAFTEAKPVKRGLHEGKKVSDNQKIIKLRCKLESNFPGECPNNGVFENTYEKYRKGASFCDTTCRDRHKKLKSKRHQQELDEKRRGNIPIQEIRIDYIPHSGGQRLIHDSPARFKVLICGARWGKDRCMIAEYIRQFAEMLSEDRSSTLIPRVHGFIVAPTYPLANQIWRELKYFFPEQWVVSKNEAEHRMETAAGGIIEVKSADNPDSLVSVGLDIVLVTEAARVKDLEYTWSYLRGRLASPGRGPKGKGGIALLNSTPKGRNFLYKMYMWGQDENYPEWASWQFPTITNPYIDPKEIDDAEKTLPRNMFRQEFLGEFLTDSGEVFANVDEISKGVAQEPEPGRTYKCSWDPAQRNDYSAFG